MKVRLHNLWITVVMLSGAIAQADEGFYISCAHCSADYVVMETTPSASSVVHTTDTQVITGNCLMRKDNLACIVQSPSGDLSVAFKLTSIHKDIRYYFSEEKESALTLDRSTSSAVYSFSTFVDTKSDQYHTAGAKVCHCSIRQH